MADGLAGVQRLSIVQSYEPANGQDISGGEGGGSGRRRPAPAGGTGTFLGSHDVIGHDLPREALVVTESRVGVGAQVFEAVARVAVVPDVGMFRSGVSDALAFRHPKAAMEPGRLSGVCPQPA
jgi:hypothetical protein